MPHLEVKMKLYLKHYCDLHRYFQFFLLFLGLQFYIIFRVIIFSVYYFIYIYIFHMDKIFIHSFYKNPFQTMLFYVLKAKFILNKRLLF
jgi:hypothetical protein